ncbi:MAG: TetR/AcrR family transcriptional regulator [Alphaproteobacteria bacterium]
MDKTKKKILDAATHVFVEKGFSGSSISDIAKTANINQSLIYHHIGNKKDLWQEVKRQLLTHVLEENINDSICDGFKKFLDLIIQQRLKAYEEDPRILRIIQWQMLEDEDNELIGENQITPVEWIKIIKKFQQEDKVKNQYSADLIALYIHTSLNAVLFDQFKIFSKNKIKKEQYINMVKEICLKNFQCEIIK